MTPKAKLTVEDKAGWYECLLGVDTRVLWWDGHDLYECYDNHLACDGHTNFRGLTHASSAEELLAACEAARDEIAHLSRHPFSQPTMDRWLAAIDECRTLTGEK